MAEFGLGRHHHPDPRDGRFLLEEIVAAPPPTRKNRYWYSSGAWLDQGGTGTCVGHAWAHFVEDGPITHKGTLDPIALYRELVLHDPWPENDHGDLQFGSTVRAGAKALQNRGIVGTYRWAWNVDTITNALLTEGPVVVGTVWYSSMFDADAEGYLRISGTIVGGHAYLINGVNLTRGVYRIKNSWGRHWARKGHAWIAIEDFERLLADDGEACMAEEVASR